MNTRKFGVDWSGTMSKIKEQENSKSNFKDDRIYYPQFQEDGTAQAVIRFLPFIEGDTDIPYVNVWSHSFRGPGGWYIENCPTTLKKECPFCKANSAIWDDMSKDDQSNRKRKLHYYANILVVNDPKNPSNNGKVFLFKYGKKIHDKVMEKLSPPPSGILKTVHVHDYYEGANFNLIIKKIKVNNRAMPNYDSCSFEGVSSVGTDEQIEKIHNSRFSLKDFIAEKNFKPFEDLKERLDRILGQKMSETTHHEKAPEIPQPSPSSKAKVEEPNIETADPEVFAGTDDDFFADLQNG